jgi:hypothetical protein
MPPFFYTGTLPPGMAGGEGWQGGGIEGPAAPTENRIALFEADGDLLESELGIEGETIVTSTGTLTLPAGTATLAKTTDIPAPGIGGSTGATDNALLRADGAGGATLQDSPLVVSDAGEISGATRLDVDNLRIDGNTISATNANGPVIIVPNGTGALAVGGSTSAFPALKRLAATSRFQVVKADGSESEELVALGFRLHDSINDASICRAALSNRQEIGLQLASGSQINWTSSASDAAQGKDTGIKRDAAGVQLDTNGSTGLGFRLTGRVVEASTAGVGSPNLLAATESRKLLTNHGATAEAYNTLPPSAPVGCEFQAYCADADGIRVTAPSGETIRTAPGSVSAGGGFIRSVVIGSGITLTKVAAAEWAAINAPNGTWTIDT